MRIEESTPRPYRPPFRAGKSTAEIPGSDSSSPSTSRPLVSNLIRLFEGRTPQPYRPPFGARKSTAEIESSSPSTSQPVEERTPPPYLPPFRRSAVGSSKTLFEESPTKEPNAELTPVTIPDVELSPAIKELIDETLEGMRSGCVPTSAPSGVSGAYFMSGYTDKGERRNISVFKAEKGSDAVNEVASYLLDYPPSGYRAGLTDDVGFSGVPPTILFDCRHDVFEGEDKRRRGSLQKFMMNKDSCENYGTEKYKEFLVEDVHKIAVLDIRLANADRHYGNLLFTQQNQLIPIDHGLCIPENFEKCRFDWIDWEQCKEPFSPNTLEYIRMIDADQDIKYLESMGFTLSCDSQQTLRIASMILKKGAAAGRTAFDIGVMFHKDDCQFQSTVEKLVSKSKEAELKYLSSLVDQHFGISKDTCICGHESELAKLKLTLEEEITRRIEAEDMRCQKKMKKKFRRREKEEKFRFWCCIAASSHAKGGEKRPSQEERGGDGSYHSYNVKNLRQRKNQLHPA